MANVNSWWSSLSPNAKRNLAVGSIGTVLIATIIGLASVSPEVAKPSSKQATIQHILTEGSTAFPPSCAICCKRTKSKAAVWLRLKNSKNANNNPMNSGSNNGLLLSAKLTMPK